MIKKLIIPFLACFMLTGCTALFVPSNDYVYEQGEPLIPGVYALYGDYTETYVPQKWWQTFNDEELNYLIDIAIAENLDIRQAWARLDQLKIRYYQSFSGFLPTIEFSGTGYSASRKGSDTRAGAVSNDTVNSESWGLGALASYEIDLWGRVYAANQASFYNLEATQDDLDTMAESIAAMVASYWVRVIAARQEVAMLNKQLVTNQKYLELVELRYVNGLVSALDVFQQQQAVARTQTQLPLAIRSQLTLENELRVLLGQTSEFDLGLTREVLPELADIPKTGLPAELLANRPDVRSAGNRLYSAEWNVAEARANRLPALRLTASGTFSSNDLSYLFNNWALSLAANLVGPIFDSGKRTMEIFYQLAVTDEILAKYQQTVLKAVSEVEIVLLNEKTQKEYLLYLTKQRQASNHALSEATIRYMNGVTDYLPVLTQLTSTQNLDITNIQQQAELLVNRITLYRALGGGSLTNEILITDNDNE